MKPRTWPSSQTMLPAMFPSSLLVCPCLLAPSQPIHVGGNLEVAAAQIVRRAQPNEKQAQGLTHWKGKTQLQGKNRPHLTEYQPGGYLWMRHGSQWVQFKAIRQKIEEDEQDCPPIKTRKQYLSLLWRWQHNGKAWWLLRRVLCWNEVFH